MGRGKRGTSEGGRGVNGLPLSWIDFAASPIIVSRPVSVTKAIASPDLTIDPDHSFFPEPGSPMLSSRGTATGSDSPVSAAWSRTLSLVHTKERLKPALLAAYQVLT